VALLRMIGVAAKANSTNANNDVGSIRINIRTCNCVITMLSNAGVGCWRPPCRCRSSGAAVPLSWEGAYMYLNTRSASHATHQPSSACNTRTHVQCNVYYMCTRPV